MARKNKKSAPPPPVTLRQVLCHGGALISVLLLVAMYSRYALDFPYADQWDFVPLLQKAYAGELSWRDFWAQHNEHRLVFPRLLMLGLAWPSQWNIYLELAANFLLAFATWGLLCLQARLSGIQIGSRGAEPVCLFFAMLVFSLSQWGNWFLGWQLQEFMNVLFAVLALCALSWRRWPVAGLTLAVLAGAVATYSFANGLLVWPIGLLILQLQREERGRLHRGLMLGWSAAALVVMAYYFVGYERPAHHGPLTAALYRPFQYFFYVLAYLGQPLGRAEDLLALAFEFAGQGSGHKSHTFSIMMGMFGLFLWGVTTTQLMLAGASKRALLPWFGMALYAVGTAALTGLGRVEGGIEQAMSSRYVTMANLLWFAVIIQTFWVGRKVDSALIRRGMPFKAAALCLLLAGASLAGAYRWTERHNAYIELRGPLISGNDAEVLRPLYPPAPEVILERRPFLEAHGLSVFAAAE